jgi:hypothetical protein
MVLNDQPQPKLEKIERWATLYRYKCLSILLKNKSKLLSEKQYKATYRLLKTKY